MLSWLALVSGLIKLANSLVGWMEKRKLITSGETQAIAKGMETTLNAISKANSIRRKSTSIDDDLNEL